MLVLPPIHYFRERISVQPYSRRLFGYVIHKVVLFHQISTPFENKMSKYVYAIPEFGRQRQDRYHTLDEPGLHIEFQVSHGYLTKPCLKNGGKGGEEVAQWLKKLAALAEDPDLAPVPHMKGPNQL